MDPYNKYTNGMNGANGASQQQQQGMGMSGLPNGLSMGLPMMPDLGLGFDQSYLTSQPTYMSSTSMMQLPTAASIAASSVLASHQHPTTSAAASVGMMSTTATSSSATGGAKKAPTRKRKAANAPSPPPSNSSPTAMGSSAMTVANGNDTNEDQKARRRAQIAKAARKHRQRQKDELVSLREKVKDLKEQIEVLQSSEPSEHDTETGWKQEAEQHAEIRARVDQENEFLRKTLMEQMKFIQRLQDYFTKQPLLNAPSLNKMLTSSSPSIPAPPTPALMPPPTMPSSFFQLPTVSFRDTLIKIADEGLKICAESIQHGEGLFKQPKVPSMTYLGVKVQYEMTKDNMHVFLRQVMHGINYLEAGDKVWELLTSKMFNQEFAFVESYEVLDTIDNDTKYIRGILNLTLPNPEKNGNGKIKAERLHAVKRRISGNAVYIASRSVNEDPSWPQTPSYIRRNQNIGIMLRDCTDDGGNGTEFMWCIKVQLDENADPSHVPNLPDTILRNLFEVTPAFFKAVIDRIQ